MSAATNSEAISKTNSNDPQSLLIDAISKMEKFKSKHCETTLEIKAADNIISKNLHLQSLYEKRKEYSEASTDIVEHCKMLKEQIKLNPPVTEEERLLVSDQMQDALSKMDIIKNNYENNEKKISYLTDNIRKSTLLFTDHFTEKTERIAKEYKRQNRFVSPRYFCTSSHSWNLNMFSGPMCYVECGDCGGSFSQRLPLHNEPILHCTHCGKGNKIPVNVR
jgi:DNA mismatch repair ATPase MutS